MAKHATKLCNSGAQPGYIDVQGQVDTACDARAGDDTGLL